MPGYSITTLALAINPAGILGPSEAKAIQPGGSNLFFGAAASRAIVIKKCSKNGRLSVDVPVIQQAKIQAQVLVPLVKALQAELGEERANALVRGALGDIYRRYGEDFWRTKNEKTVQCGSRPGPFGASSRVAALTFSSGPQCALARG
jgi:hypothetical protein